MISRLKMKEPFVPAMLDFLSRDVRATGYPRRHLVTLGFPPSSGQGTIRVLHDKTGSVFKWNICHHSNGSSLVFQVSPERVVNLPPFRGRFFRLSLSVQYHELTDFQFSNVEYREFIYTWFPKNIGNKLIPGVPWCIPCILEKPYP